MKAVHFNEQFQELHTALHTSPSVDVREALAVLIRSQTLSILKNSRTQQMVNYHDMEDIAQHSTINMLKQCKKLTPEDIDNPNGLLTVITQRSAYTHIRKDRRFPGQFPYKKNMEGRSFEEMIADRNRPVEIDENTLAERRTINNVFTPEEAKCLQTLIDQVDAMNPALQNKAILTNRFFAIERIPYKEHAKTLGISQGTYKSRMHNALIKLHGKLEQVEDRDTRLILQEQIALFENESTKRHNQIAISR